MKTIASFINSKIFRFSLFFLSVLYSLSFITWSLWEDNYYYYNLFTEYSNYAMIPFSLFVGKVFTTYVNENMLWVNFLAWLLCFSSILIVYLGWVERKDWIKKIHFFSIGLIFLGFGTFSTFGPDTFSLFFLVLSCYLLCRQSINKMLILFMVSILTAFLIAARLPNVVFIPIAFSYICVKSLLLGLGWLKSVRNALIYIFFSILFYWLLMYALTGRLDIFNVIRESFSFSVSSYNTHSIRDLTNNYRGDFFLSCRALAWVVGAIAMSYLCGLVQHKNKILQAVGWLPLIYLLYKEQSSLLGAMYGWKSLCGFLSIFLIMCIVRIREYEPTFTLNSLLLVSAGFVMAAGSDTGLMKIGVFFSAISPIILMEYNNQYKINFYSGGVLVILSLFALYYHVAPLKNFFPISITHYNRSTQILSQYRKIQLEDRLGNVEKYGKKDHCIFYGLLGFRVQTILGSKLLYRNSFWQHTDDDIETDNIVRMIQSDSLCTVFDYNNSIMLKEKMLKAGATCIQQSGNGTIYKH